MWEFYLAASETAFRWQDLVNFQIQLTKRVDTLPMTRDYMLEAEAKLRERDRASLVENESEAWRERAAAE